MSVIKSPRPVRRPAMDPEFSERRRRRRRLSGGMLMSDLLVLQSMGDHHPTQPSAPHTFMAWDLLFRQSSMTHLYS